MSTTSMIQTEVPTGSICLQCRHAIDGIGFRCMVCNALYCEDCVSLIRQKGTCNFCKLKIVQEESTTQTISPQPQRRQELGEALTPQPLQLQKSILTSVTASATSKCVYCHQQIGNDQAFRCSICGALYDRACIITLRQTGKCLFCKAEIQSLSG